MQQLTQQGLRKPKTLRSYVTYTVRAVPEAGARLSSKSSSPRETLWKSLYGEFSQIGPRIRRLQTVLTKAFYDGFLAVGQVLSNKMGLTVRPLEPKSCGYLLWQRFKFCRLRRHPRISSISEWGYARRVLQ